MLSSGFEYKICIYCYVFLIKLRTGKKNIKNSSEFELENLSFRNYQVD